MKNQLPENWALATIGDLAKYINGRVFRRSEWKPKGKPIIRIQNLNNPDTVYNFSDSQHEDRYIVKHGDLLFAWSASLGAHIWKGGDAWLNQHIFNVIPENGIDKSYLYYLLSKITAELYAKAHGSGMVHVTKEKFGSTKILLPPTNEQKRIVAKIEELFSELDNGIAALKTAREQLKVYRQAVLKHAFEGKLTAKWREENADKLETPEQLLVRIQKERDTRYQQQLAKWKSAVKAWEANGKEGKKPGKPKKLAQFKSITEGDCVHYSTLPSGWSYVRLGMLVDEPTYGTSAKCDYDSGSQGVLRIPNIINGVINDSDLKFANFEKGEVDHLRLEEGDILTIRSNGSISLVGSCALIFEKDTQYIFAGYLIRLRPNSNLVLPPFLLPVMASHLLRKQIESAAKSTSGVNNINSGELQNLIIPLPSVDEQNALLNSLDALLSSINAAEVELTNQINKSDTLRQSILKKAFSGQLVPQDPNDEPASELLARIKTKKLIAKDKL